MSERKYFSWRKRFFFLLALQLQPHWIGPNWMALELVCLKITHSTPFKANLWLRPTTIRLAQTRFGGHLSSCFSASARSVWDSLWARVTCNWWLRAPQELSIDADKAFKAAQFVFMVILVELLIYELEFIIYYQFQVAQITPIHLFSSDGGFVQCII